MRVLSILISLLLGTAVYAEQLPPPTGPIILSVSGNIAHTNGDGVAQFDREMLRKLSRRQTLTMTPWYDEAHQFEGPLASAVLAAVGAQGQALRVVALNDYASGIPFEDTQNYPVIFATHLDGNEMSVREKGPLFLLYPFDDYPELFNEVYFGRSVWQIKEIEVLGE